MLERVCRPSALADSWKRVLANDVEDDVLSPGVRRFARDADTLLDELRGRLLDGGYLPARLVRVSILKEDGAERVLHIPLVVDRIVERAVLSVLTPLLDPLLGPSSFAYRPRKWRGCGTRGSPTSCGPTSTTASPTSGSTGSGGSSACW